MALSARTPTTLDTYKFIPEMYALQVVEAVKSKLVAWDSIDTEWRNNLKKGDTLYITKTNTVTATEVVVGSKGTALNPFNTAAVTLAIDQWFEAPIDIDYMSKYQSHIEMEKHAVKEGAYAIAKKIDTSVCTLFSTLNGSTVKGTDGSAVTDELLEEIRELLEEADVPMDDPSDLSLIVDPSVVNDMMKYDKFIMATYVQMGAVATGVIAKNHPLYGCSIKVTNNLVAATTGAYACMLHRKAIGGAAQILDSPKSTWVKEFEELHQTRYHTEALWGVIEVMDTFGIPFYTRKA